MVFVCALRECLDMEKVLEKMNAPFYSFQVTKLN